MGSVAGTDPFVGRLVGKRYKLVRPLGRGGMGAVYEGVQLHLARRVAVKLLVDVDASALARFRQEALASASIHHPNVVQVTDLVVDDDGPPALVVELLEGEDLKDLLGREGRLPPARAVRIALQMLSALAAAHATTIVHRDVKPANVFLVKAPHNPDFVKLLDFGIAKFVDDVGGHKTTAGAIVGTPAYMAPEQIDRRPLDPRTDLHAVGVCLHEMLTGDRTFRGDDLASVVQSVRSVVPARVDAVVPGVPRAVGDAVARALEKDPGARFTSAAEMSAALERALGPSFEAADTIAEGPVSSPPRRTSLSQIVALLALALLVPLALVLALVVERRGFSVGVFGPRPSATSSPAASEEEPEPEEAPTAVLPLVLPDGAPTASCYCVADEHFALCDAPKCRCVGSPASLCYDRWVTRVVPGFGEEWACPRETAAVRGKAMGDPCAGYLHPAWKDGGDRGIGRILACGCYEDMRSRQPASVVGTPCAAIDPRTLERRTGRWTCMTPSK